MSEPPKMSRDDMFVTLREIDKDMQELKVFQEHMFDLLYADLADCEKMEAHVRKQTILHEREVVEFIKNCREKVE